MRSVLRPARRASSTNGASSRPARRRSCSWKASFCSRSLPSSSDGDAPTLPVTPTTPPVAVIRTLNRPAFRSPAWKGTTT